MIKTKTQILNEGRYDSLTREISNDVMSVIKSDYDMYDATLPKDRESYSHESGIDFPVYVVVNRVEEISIRGKIYDFIVNTFIDDDFDVVMEITIDSNSEPQSYEKLFYKISEDIRHEIEHYTQLIFNDRPKMSDTADMDTTFRHHMEPSEIEALVHGFFRRAKLEKKPLDVIMREDLDDDIEKGNLTKGSAEILLQIWVKFARRRLPHAVYSNQ